MESPLGAYGADGDRPDNAQQARSVQAFMPQRAMALGAALIAVVIISAVQLAGAKLKTTFASISGNLK